MSRIQLAIEIPNTKFLDRIRIKDASFYDFQDVCKGTLQIKPPGFGWKEFHEDAFFDKYYTTKNLGMQCSNCDDELMSLPDGIWKVNYMLNDNHKTTVEYYHLRNSQQTHCFNKIRDYIFSLECTLSRKDFNERARNLLIINQRMDAAKWRVEEQGEEDGMLIYNEVNNMLDEYKNECGCL